ncbi:DUF6603 domain-containing protein [Ornithinimicrobium cryptoxanthini]|uniref:DUF6603 domain-containing protein n=1 Tax=Ornithinimicrobium cryptoxanthini TaxID=2934161 RepID=UPI00211742D9|nr:DUF6603 domain-containing protein [Ornithinimicrobium cryptoxanthini]
MTIAESGLESFAQLTRALGITTTSGGPNAKWFQDPVGGTTENPTGLKTILANDDQREALVQFVDEVLGPPEADQREETTWLPLFRNPDPELTIYAVLTPVTGAVQLGIGVAHSSGDLSPRVTTRLHAPLFRVPRDTATLPSDSATSLPSWLLLGREAGRVAIEVDATFTDDAPTPGEAFLRGLRAGIEVPTDGVSDVGFTLTLRDLQIPGATAPSSPTLDLDSLDDLGEDVFTFAVGLLRSQLAALDTNDAGLRIAAALSGLLGLRDIPNVPAFPLADLPQRGVAAITDWISGILADNDALDAWLGQLALLTGGSARPADDAVAFSIGDADLLLGMRVTPGADGHLVLIPWLRLDLEASPGAVVAVSADLFRAETATGAVVALPALDLSAVFGAEAPAPKLLATGPVRIRSVRVGVGIDEQRHPTPRLTLHDVDLAAGTSNATHHDVLDLSSPDAALAAVDDVVADLLTNLLDDLGPAGALLATALGTDPPTGVDPVSVPALLADPLTAMAAYWREVLAAPAAARELLSDLAHLLLGTPTSITGDGTAEDPWLLPLHPSVAVALAVRYVENVLTVSVSARPTHTLTDTALGDVAVSASVVTDLLRVDLDTGSAAFVTGFSGSVQVAAAGPDPLHLPLMVADLDVAAVGLEVTWTPGAGLLLTPSGDLSLTWSDVGGPTTLPLPMPVRAPDGTLTLTSDWDGVELALGRLLLAPELSAIHPFVHLLGWAGTGPRLTISALLDDPVAALEDWAADLALECTHLHTTLSAIATLFSAGQVSVPFGLGRRGAPYRAPVGGHPSLPGLAVWTEPPCPRPSEWGGTSGFEIGPEPSGADFVAALETVARDLPELADLLTARPSLDSGLDALITRSSGIDGLVAAGSGLPDGVTSAVLAGYGHAEARAASVLDLLPWTGMGPAPADRVHLTTDLGWWQGHPESQRIDATGGTVPALPTVASGPWFVLVPAVTASGPGTDGIAAQADRIAEVLRERTGAVTLVAHGGPGAAALRAAARPALTAVVGAVATVGSPWTAVPTATFVGHGGNALTFLSAFAGSDLPELPDDQLAHFSGPLQRSFGLLRRLRQERLVADLPNAAAEVIRPGLTVHAITGSLTTSDVVEQLGALMAQAVDERIGSSTAPEPVEHLHAGLGLPAVDVAVGPISLGVRADLSLLSVQRADPRVRSERVLTTAIRLAVTDGWLLGGPGATQRDLEVRWVEIALRDPLDGSEPTCELVLHEAHAYTASRERWVVRADGLDPEATLALPEVKLILSAVATRIHAEAPSLSALLTDYGLFREGGLDPTGLDRLLFDTRAFLSTPLQLDPATVVGHLCTVLGTPVGPTPTTLRLGSADASVDIDLATGTVSAAATVEVPGAAAVTASLTVPARELTGGSGLGGATNGTGTSAQLSIGSLEPHDGVRLDAELGPAGPSVTLTIPGASGPQTVPVYPTLIVADVTEALLAFSPAVFCQALLNGLRGALSRARAAVLDEVLTQLGLLDPVLDRLGVPVAVLIDPIGYLRRRPDPLGTALSILEALADLVVPGRTGSGWPITDEVRLSYALVAGRLELLVEVDLDTTVDTAAVDLTLAGGLRIDTSGTVHALATASGSVDGYGLALRVGTSTTSPVTLDLTRPGPATALAIYPVGPGLGGGLEIAGAAAQAAVVVALNELIARRGTGDSSIQQVGAVADHLALGLGLVADPLGTDHALAPAQVSAFAADPGARLLARLPDLTAHLLASIATALGSDEITATPVGTATRIAYGTTAYLELDGPTRQVRLGATVDLDGAGVLEITQICIGAAGVSVEISVGPVTVDLGSVLLFPLVTIRAGVGGSSFDRMVGVGLATSVTGTESVEVRWALDSTAPQIVAVTSGAPSTDPATIATRALGLAVNIASGVLAEQLASVLTTEVTARLQDVVFTGGSAAVDPGLVEALIHPETLLDRLYTLVWNCATVGTPVSVKIEDTLEIGLTSVATTDDRQHLGLRLSLPDGEELTLVEGSLTVALECNSRWIVPEVQPGLSILLLEGTATSLQLVPGVIVGGLGVRFTASGQPLLDLGSVSLDGIAVRVYGEASAAGVGGGAQLVLEGLSVAPGGGGGTNPVANGIMNDVGAASESARPTFSPSLAVQKSPGQDLAISLRAGDPPGPWWVVIERQLGPLYVDRIGFDSVENNGRVTKISLLFTGQLDLFGLTAAVDELALSWEGGDVLAISSWSVDLMGLAVSADMAGVSLSGGLLKIEQGSSTSYVGMLVGRFAAYGLSVFGGFTHDGQDASFFIFGGVNGPIGGPPAFFLTGIAGGLGINRGLRVPDDLSQFGSYPFIAALNPAAPQREPMEALHELSHYFPHQVGNFWFAGGISFTSFALIDGIAVVAVSFGSSGLDINLFGLARMALPRPGAALVSIELAIVVRFSLSEGVFMIRAQLTDNSWLLYPEIRLTGGFAFAIWWKGPLAGQFVLTMGGYHPTFHVEGYPDVPRLGLVWRISDSLVIKGESYFALTSEALMAGQSVEASLDLGWVWAKVTFSADGIVYFDPFSFDVKVRASISAGIHIDLWLTTLSLSITISAEIHVWGPDFAGKVTFEIGPATVPIRFGSNRRVEPETLAWVPFVEKYLERGSGNTARALSAITGRGTLPTSTKGETGAPSADGSATLPYRVFAEFEITFTSSIPATALTIGTASPLPVAPTLAGSTTSLGLAPMGLRDLTPTLRIRLERKTGSGGWTAHDSKLGPLAAGLNGNGPASYATESFPLGVFGAPHVSASNTRLPNHEVVVAAHQVTLVAGIIASTPGPPMDYYKVECKQRPLPLQATRTSRASMVNLGRTLEAPLPVNASEALTQAQTILFEHGHEQHSAVARASFAADRSAPPMFGTLTDGLVADNGADGERSRLPVAATPKRRPRRPIVVGLLESGDLAVRRPAGTTVADGRLKRRPAPSTVSVQSRLSTRLPIALTRSSPSVTRAGATLAATTFVPRTTAASTGHVSTGSRLAARDLQGLVTGLGPGAGLVPRAERARRLSRAASSRNAELAQSIAGGDVIILESLDARYDGDPDRRPHLTIAGTARVLALTGRSIVTDVEVDGRRADQSVPVPSGATLIAVHAGGDIDPELGFAGWHDGSRIARVGGRVGLAAGCALSVDGLAAQEGQGAAWQPAHTLTGGAREVLTRFTRPVRTVAIALTRSGGSSPDDTVPADVPPETDLRLSGATVAGDDGVDRPPILVALGGVSVLVYPVVPDEQTSGVGVTVTNGPAWSLVGVVGADDTPEDLAAQIAEAGLPGVISRVTAVEGQVAVGWLDARRTP